MCQHVPRLIKALKHFVCQGGILQVGTALHNCWRGVFLHVNSKSWHSRLLGHTAAQVSFLVSAAAAAGRSGEMASPSASFLSPSSSARFLALWLLLVFMGKSAAAAR